MTEAMISWLYVADVEASVAFYAEGLGAQIVLRQLDCAVLAVAGQAYVGLCQRPPPRSTPGLLLCFLTPDVPAATDRLVAAGAELEQAPAVNDTYGIEHAFLRDPDGHRLEVQRFLDPGALNP